MGIRVVRLGTPRQRGEGLRLGTVRRLPRGVKKTAYAKKDYFDLWLPELSPSEPLVKLGLKADSPAAWKRFAARYRREMQQPSAHRLIALLSALSRETDLSVGCYCEDESRCHRSVLRALLAENGADVR